MVIIMNEKFMEIALKEAKKAYIMGEVPIGAVIVKDNKIISKAHNTKNNKNCIINHAEINAIVKASKKLNNWRLIDCEMYVTMIPCPMCASAINQSRLSKIYYGTDNSVNNFDNLFKILNDTKYGNKVEIFGGILAQDCGKIVKDFFSEKR